MYICPLDEPSMIPPCRSWMDDIHHLAGPCTPRHEYVHAFTQLRPNAISSRCAANPRKKLGGLQAQMLYILSLRLRDHLGLNLNLGLPCSYRVSHQETRAGLVSSRDYLPSYLYSNHSMYNDICSLQAHKIRLAFAAITVCKI